jgi:hypothetical protein
LAYPAESALAETLPPMAAPLLFVAVVA